MGSKQRDRVDNFVHAEPAPPLRLTIGFAASSAELVLDRVRSVMKQVAEAQLESWPSDGQWQQQRNRPAYPLLSGPDRLYLVLK